MSFLIGLIFAFLGYYLKKNNMENNQRDSSNNRQTEKKHKALDKLRDLAKSAKNC